MAWWRKMGDSNEVWTCPLRLVCHLWQSQHIISCYDNVIVGIMNFNYKLYSTISFTNNPREREREEWD